MSSGKAFDPAPSIRVRDPSPNHNHQQAQQLQHHILHEPAASSAAAPMPITTKPRDSPPPPPLPPPRYIEGLGEGHDSAWHFANRTDDSAAGSLSSSSSIKPGSSLLGGHAARPGASYTGEQRSVDFGDATAASRSQPSSPRLKDPHSNERDRVPDLNALLEFNKLQGERHMGQRHVERSSHAYDKSVLQRIGGPHTPPRSAPALSNEDSSVIAQNTLQRLNNSDLRPLSVPSTLPERRLSSHESTGPRWASVPQPSSPALSVLRSPFSDNGMAQTQARQADELSGSLNTPQDPHRPPHERLEQTSLENREYHAASQDQFKAERSPAGSDYQQNPKTGQKRRALSPPSEAVLDPTLRSSNNSDDWQRPRSGDERHDPQNRPQAQSASLSSNTSSLPQNSYPSSYGVSLASSATSYASERLPPGSYQPAAQNDSHAQAQQQAYDAQSINQPPPVPVSNGGPPPIPHRRQNSTSGGPRPPGLWICDCCPKKPKKFENEQELRAHESEKQYVCQYCHNRFKNKNEAERHQNSLHLRRHSWSCASLTSFDMAFHATPASNISSPNLAHGPHGQFPPPAQTDTCGYCGVQFNNPPNWDERVEHLNHVHKFGECNQSKKFFRADHFRQHLKHSHAGTSGKWTNMLENACMKDEPPPQPIHPSIAQQQAQQQQQQQQGGAPLASMMPPVQVQQNLPPARITDLRDASR